MEMAENHLFFLTFNSKENTMKKHTFLILVTLLALVMMSACKDKKVEISPDIASSDEQLYNIGQEHVKKNPEKARLYFRQIIDSFPKSFYAQRAKLAIADSYFKKGDEGNMIIAAAEYREFISLYPYSPSASYAQYQIALSFFKKKLKPGRDQSKTHQALTELKKVITNYPLSEEAKDTRAKIKECEEYLAKHVLSIAKHYYKTKAYKAAISRLNDILNNYIEYSEMDKVYFYIGDSNFRAGLYEESIPFFTKLITDYPKSKLAKKAQKRMEEISRKNLEKK
jgi:outer membrane protein assembly factor BamD